MEIGHTSLTAEPRLVRNSAAQWRCDLVPARRQTDSCAALGSASCELHYELRRAASSDAPALCSSADAAGCEAGPALDGCGLWRSEPAAAGRALAQCIEEAAGGIHEEVLASTMVSYRDRVNHTMRGMRPALERVWSEVGYVGAAACATFLTSPVGGASRSGWVQYSLLLFNSFVCPPLDAEASAGAWPTSALNFSCVSGQPPVLISRPGLRAPVARGAGAEAAAVGASHAPVSHWLSHVWGCSVVRPTENSVTGFTLAPYDSGGGAEANPSNRSSMRHVHLPPEACDAARQAVRGRSALIRQLREVHAYQAATDPTDHGKHGLMHEFGVLVARRLLDLRDDDALNGAWQLFAQYYVTPAPMHSFLSTVFGARRHVDGLPIDEWAVRFCQHFLFPSPSLGDPALSDRAMHLFGECVHGIGHGMAVHGNTLKTAQSACDAVATQFFDAAARPPVWGDLRAFFRSTCFMGCRHHLRNNGGRSVPYNSTAWLARALRSVY